MSLEYSEKVQQLQHNYIYDNIVDGFPYQNDEENLINYHQHYHQSQAQQQNSYPFTIHHSSNTQQNNYLKEEQLYFIPHHANSVLQHENTGLNFPTTQSYHQNHHMNQQTHIPNASSQQQFAAPFPLNITGNSKQSQSAPANNQQTNYLFQNPTHQYQNNNNNNKLFSAGLNYAQKNVKNTLSFNNQTQYNFDLNQGHFYKNVQETFPSIQTLNDADTAVSSTNDLQTTQNFSSTSLNQQPSVSSNYFNTENNNFKQADGLIMDDQNTHFGIERKNSVEAKNEEPISSQHSLCEKFSNSSKNTSPIINGSMRKISDSESDGIRTSTSLGLNKQQSQLKNANKFCMVSLLNFLTDILPNSKDCHHLIKYIIRVKGSGKLRQKVDIFTLAHFRVLFLTLNDWNITQLNSNDIKMHKMIFSEVKNAIWTKEDLEFMNSIKQQLLYLSIEFFEDSSNIKQKIQSKSWQNEDTAKHYIEWVNRISKGIKKMSTGVYIHRF